MTTIEQRNGWEYVPHVEYNPNPAGLAKFRQRALDLIAEAPLGGDPKAQWAAVES